ncbi:HAD family hydrolase [Streptococcus panodentis]|uniref:HAD family phosphatase n=1 Tax=Streptococcus panodentis TaxID=1581472 RepID=A0ABS5AXB8_9STRE|nr:MULTISPECIES: HAD family phosphatase [Streptococcus]KXT84697.1 HAD superfamily hydrolase [Streptococcus sp. DD11]MBP2621217.1 HAD family phosphatase [Streptococcus panodentis]
MIDTIVFDMGNVLIEWNPQKVIDFYEKDAERANRLNLAIFQSQIWHQVDKGLLPLSDAVKQVCLRLDGSYSKTIENIFYNWYQALDKRLVLQQAAISYAKKGYHIYILSNTSEIYYRLEEDWLPIAKVIQGKLLSFEEKLMKPDASIYRCFLERYDLKASNCLFLDDMAENVQAAKTVGMEAIQVFDEKTAVEQLNHYLERFGKY